ncbi:MAG: M6 family metalloprotease domain-containing protein [Gemmatimonadetes bacterium]|uniref:M6 family metalloprotease domain-containing protein n=1 Tax=Candidatus Kutchimonas denitrificans TaxID=3056748 RepID=A0AAE4Z6N4_9BACT|nr:M6 family metalloprotease domain-containing protein [Gemmatimonadota bacterium]NIR74735.1 M6 family metalloprotease domain-containing protein [Candidatus Kutchimonas denitrificans]NIS01485.1 M6 family metalloprotease domain-containing protein [Gemmatimonadota bacterium]NIT67226.1 M6 family metalloprotease domain-containing protein [Gemmatimonadota bacterium]NIU52400.1 M6 family metalloprotease domain-containing protein [Gemmatimonadota bacterium]
MRSYVFLCGCAALTLGLVATELSAQGGASDIERRGRIHGVQPPPGFYRTLASDPDAYQFRRVWKSVALQVRERRQALARQGDYATLNRHLSAGAPSRATAQESGAAVTGTFRFPVLVGYFTDSTHKHQPDTATLNSTMFSTAAAPPYSISTYYDESSNSLLSVTGDVIGWHKTDSASTWYEGSNNGLSPSTDHTGDFIKELLDAADATIDFSVYDGDNDGFVDLIAVLHPLKDGACGSSHIWAHRGVYSKWKGSPYATDDDVAIDDYVIQSAVGGSSGCDSTQTMAIGTMAHELGHGILNLPDLYDTGDSSEGIGWWGLMGSGNWNTQDSPAHLSAWSKDEVGWIAVDTISLAAGTGARSLRPIVSGDTALRINLEGTSEYFLLENRHRIGSDANLAGEGLAIWHVAPDLITARRPSNTVNAVDPHGLDLEQADGLDNLGNDVNRGDSGDLYPGLTANTAFGPSTAPSSELTDNSASGLTVDSITVNGDQSVAFRVVFNTVDELVTTSVGAGTRVLVDAVYRDAPYSVTKIYPGSMEISVDAIQGDTLIRHVFQSWSDGGARTHTVMLDATPDTFTANLETEHRVRATADLSGTVQSSQPLDSNGIRWMLPSDSIELVGVATASGWEFAHWSGDTTYNSDTLLLHMSRPWTVHARFGTPITVSTDTLFPGVMGATYTDTLTASGGTGSYTWTLVGGDSLPEGLSLEATTGAITGFPEDEGTFAMFFQAASGAITQADTVHLSVTRPSLQTTDVVNHLIGPVSVLSDDEERFLDIIGNNNGGYDVGDLRAYLQSVGISADLIPADLLETEDGVASKEGNQ